MITMVHEKKQTALQQCFLQPQIRRQSTNNTIKTLRDRLTAGHKTLNLVIMVRIHVSEHLSMLTVIKHHIQGLETKKLPTSGSFLYYTFYL